MRSELLEARRATAFFARKLAELSDAELDASTRLPGWTRRHVVAHVGYNARALCRLAFWARTGVPHPMYASPGARDREIARGATLQAHALRHLFDHSAVSLSVEWRDTPDAAWRVPVRTATGREVAFSETVWMRLRELWLHAIDLDNGARWDDVPAPIVERLLVDMVGTWTARGETPGFVLSDPVSGFSAAAPAPGGAPSIRIAGPLPALLAWASGRGRVSETAGLDVTGIDGAPVRLPEAPRWL
ncbi:mycothiol-dependent maleylpyruvate isomerase NagL [Leucobacter iarius]|uniref:Mycothiol-dependent maleylpyruvate isomerase NagL n=1 Tax=Leucobacter iarius TaxID=333963 RepID=A0ABP4Y0D2_9MICO